MAALFGKHLVNGSVLEFGMLEGGGMIDRLRFAGTVLIVAVCTVMTMVAITQALSFSK